MTITGSSAAQGGHRPHGPRGRAVRRGGPAPARGRRGQEPGRATRLPDREEPEGLRRQDLRRGPVHRRVGADQPEGEARRRRRWPITSATEPLQQASYKLAEAVYAQAQPGPGQAQAGTTTTTDQGTAQADGDVVDAEIIDEGDQDQQKGQPLGPGGGRTIMSVSRWDPFQDLLAIQDEMNQVFGRARQGQAGGRVWAPALDISERKDAYVVTVEVPGVKADDLDITLEDSLLTIRVSASSPASPQSSSTTGSSAATAASAARSPCPPRCRPTPSRPRSTTGCSRSSCPRPRRPSRRRSPFAPPAAVARRCRGRPPRPATPDPDHAIGEEAVHRLLFARGDSREEHRCPAGGRPRGRRRRGARPRPRSRGRGRRGRPGRRGRGGRGRRRPGREEDQAVADGPTRTAPRPSRRSRPRTPTRRR